MATARARLVLPTPGLQQAGPIFPPLPKPVVQPGIRRYRLPVLRPHFLLRRNPKAPRAWGPHARISSFRRRSAADVRCMHPATDRAVPRETGPKLRRHAPRPGRRLRRHLAGDRFQDQADRRSIQVLYLDLIIARPKQVPREMMPWVGRNSDDGCPRMDGASYDVVSPIGSVSAGASVTGDQEHRPGMARSRS